MVWVESFYYCAHLIGNQNLKITMNENSTLQMLREQLQKETGILPENQKITFRGIMKDNEKSLKELKVGDGVIFNIIFLR